MENYQASDVTNQRPEPLKMSSPNQLKDTRRRYRRPPFLESLLGQSDFLWCAKSQARESGVILLRSGCRPG